MSVAAAACGLTVGGGAWLAVTGWRAAAPAVRSRRPRVPEVEGRRLAAAAGAGLLALVVSRWPVAAAAATGVAWIATGTSQRRQRLSDDRRTEAIALWTEMLRDAIGTARGVEGVLVATAATAPGAIRPEVQAMARRLAHEPLDVALDQLAADLDHPIGDLVVTALRLASTAGGRQVRDVLANLAAAAYAETESRRRVDVARQRPRAAMRYSAIIIAAFIALLLVFSRSYLAPYDSPVGQLVLAFVASYWAIGFWWMSRMGRTPPRPRLFDEAEAR